MSGNHVSYGEKWALAALIGTGIGTLLALRDARRINAARARVLPLPRASSPELEPDPLELLAKDPLEHARSWVCPIGRVVETRRSDEQFAVLVEGPACYQLLTEEGVVTLDDEDLRTWILLPMPFSDEAEVLVDAWQSEKVEVRAELDWRAESGAHVCGIRINGRDGQSVVIALADDLAG